MIPSTAVWDSYSSLPEDPMEIKLKKINIYRMKLINAHVHGHGLGLFSYSINELHRYLNYCVRGGVNR